MLNNANGEVTKPLLVGGEIGKKNCSLIVIDEIEPSCHSCQRDHLRM